MNSKAWFVISVFSVFFTVALALTAGTNCGSEEPFPAASDESAKTAAIPLNALCVEASEETSSVEEEKIFLRPRDSSSPCDESSREIVISRHDPKVVVLNGISHVEYCIGVKRWSGYITISHPRGTVTRTGDLFTWCVAKQPKYPDHMIIRSLTAKSAFTLLVP